MSLQSPTYEIAKANHKPMVRRPMKRRSSAIPYSVNSLGARKKKTTKAKKLSVGTLKRKAWKEFSIFIRTRRADEYGYVRCVTCGVRRHWKEVDAGHFLAGRYNSNLFDERGCNEQCKYCNGPKSSNGPMYYKWMLANHGQEVIDELIRQNDETRKWNPGQLESIFLKYKELNSISPRADGREAIVKQARAS